MDCIQCGERKGFRKATATARMARPRPPPRGRSGWPRVPLGSANAPHTPSSARTSPPAAQRRLHAKAGGSSRHSFHRAVRPVLALVSRGQAYAPCMRSVFPYAEPSFLVPRWSSVQRLATAVALLHTERRRTPSGLASAAHVAFDRLASTSPIRPHVLLRS